MDEEDSDTSFGCERFTQCLGCDAFDSVNDLGLCAKLRREAGSGPDAAARPGLRGGLLRRSGVKT